MSKKFKVIATRFSKVFIAGFFSTAAVISLQSAASWSDLGTALNALLLAGVIGGISGVLVAGEKWYRWVD